MQPMVVMQMFVPRIGLRHQCGRLDRWVTVGLFLAPRHRGNWRRRRLYYGTALRGFS